MNSSSHIAVNDCLKLFKEMLCNVSVTEEKKKLPIVTKSKYYYLTRSEPKLTHDQTEKPPNIATAKTFFKKKFQFRKQLHWKLPLIINDTEKNKTVPQLIAIKNELNHVKDKLNDIPLDAWSKYTAKRDPSSAIAWFIRNEIKAEFVTKAWCKIFECLAGYSLVKVDNSGAFNSVRNNVIIFRNPIH